MVMKIAIPDSVEPAELPVALAGIDEKWELTAELDDYESGSTFTTEK